MRESLGYIQRAIDLAGPLDELLDTRARILFESGKRDAGLKDMGEAVNAAPSPARLNDYAAMLQKAGKVKDAERARARPAGSASGRTRGRSPSCPPSKLGRRSAIGSATGSRTRPRVVGVVGLGYVGLPLAETFAAGGFPVPASTSTPTRSPSSTAAKATSATSPPSAIAELVASGPLRGDRPTSRRLGEADAIVICVPTPLTEAREPDLSYIVSTGRTIGRHLRPGQLVVLESTTYPGTTRRGAAADPRRVRGLRAGQDFFLAYSPEREDPGNPNFSAANIPKVVGGLDAGQPRAGRRAVRAGRRRRRAGLQHPRWPRRARSWRTPTGR